MEVSFWGVIISSLVVLVSNQNIELPLFKRRVENHISKKAKPMVIFKKVICEFGQT
jgi:hypothetical protein